MATLLGNTYVFPLPSGGCCVCIAPNNTATMGRGLLGGTGGCAQQATAKNTTFGFRIANYGSASNLKNSVLVGYNVAQGFGNSAACNASCANTLIGSRAGYDIRSGANGAVCGCGNTFFGHRTGWQNQFGSRNIALGPFSAFSLGNYTADNIAMGDVAFRGYSTTGKRNIAIGCNAYQAAANSCTDNIFIGSCSGKYAQARLGLTAVGFRAAAGGGTQNDKGVSIGAYSSVSGICSTVIGRGATGGDCANKISITVNCSPGATAHHTLLGNSNHSRAYIAYPWTNVSDQRDKTNIKSLSPNLGLPFIKKLNPVTFNWDKRSKYVEKCGFEWGQRDGTLIEPEEQYGFIAQEMEEALNELNVKFEALGKQKSEHNKNVDVYDLRYLELISPMVQSLKDLIEDLENTEVRLEVLKS
jgi:hypothetical protein